MLLCCYLMASPTPFPSVNMADCCNYVKLRNIEGKLLVRKDKEHGCDGEKKYTTPNIKIDESHEKIELSNTNTTTDIESETVHDEKCERKTPESDKEADYQRKGILKHQRKFSNKHVDFNMDLEFVPFDETKDYTIEIQIVEQMPKKIVSYAALFAQQKKEEEERKIHEEKLKKEEANEKQKSKLKMKRKYHEVKKYRKDSERSNKKSIIAENQQCDSNLSTNETTANHPKTEDEMDNESEEEFNEHSYMSDNAQEENFIKKKTSEEIMDRAENNSLTEQKTEKENNESLEIPNNFILSQTDFMIKAESEEQNIFLFNIEETHDENTTELVNFEGKILPEVKNISLSDQISDNQNTKTLILSNDLSLTQINGKDETEGETNIDLLNTERIQTHLNEKKTEQEKADEKTISENKNISLSKEIQNIESLKLPNDIRIMQTIFKTEKENEEKSIDPVVINEPQVHNSELRNLENKYESENVSLLTQKDEGKPWMRPRSLEPNCSPLLQNDFIDKMYNEDPHIDLKTGEPQSGRSGNVTEQSGGKKNGSIVQEVHKDKTENCVIF